MSESPKQQAGSSQRAKLLLAGQGGAFGLKAGMTQVYDQNGQALAVTVIDLSSTNIVTQVKTKENSGYSAVQIGFLEKKNPKKVNKPETGHFKKSNANGFYHTAEFRLDGVDLSSAEVGSALDIGFLKEGDLVDLSSTSKGKGFQGGMKRFHMAGGFKTHGASLVHRSLGSIGNRADPGKCFKNKKMPGQMGNVKTTVQNVKVVKIDVENKLLLVHGSVPGPKRGIVSIRKAVKSMEKGA
jgi:large subunit ribosomal protein L3